MKTKLIYVLLFIFSLTLALEAKTTQPKRKTPAPKPAMTETVNLSSKVEALSNEVSQLETQLRELASAVDSLKIPCCTKPDLSNDLEKQTKILGSTNDLVCLLVQYGNNPEGLSAMHYAVKSGDVNAVSLLLSCGADPNAKYKEHTALTRAARYNQFEVAKILLESGADVNFFASEGDQQKGYALNYAAEFGSGDLVNLLIEHGALLDEIYPKIKITPLHTAAKTGNYEAVVALVNNGEDKVNASLSQYLTNNSHYGTPLDWAASNLTYQDNPQNLELIKFLVEHGANRKNRSGDLRCPVIQGYLQSVGK